MDVVPWKTMIVPYIRKYARAMVQNTRPLLNVVTRPESIGTFSSLLSSVLSPVSASRISSNPGLPTSCGWSRMNVKQRAASTMVTSASTKKTFLHPMASDRYVNGAAAARAPTLPTAITMPLSCGKSFRPYHTDIIFISGMYTTAMPAAMSILPIAKVRKSVPMHVRNEPAVASMRKMVVAFLGPSLSDSRPLGICMAA